MTIKKGAIVSDRQWPEFGNGAVTVCNRKRCTVLFSSGAKRYQSPFAALVVVKTAEESEALMKEVFREWAEADRTLSKDANT